MNRNFYTLLFGLTLLGCAVTASTASTVETVPIGPAAHIIEQNNDEMIELMHDMEEERVKAIYVVVISEPEVITAKPPEK